MPEISDVEFRQFVRYQNFGTPDEIQKKISDLESDNHKQREQLRNQEPRLLKENEVAVPKADAESLPKYKELGKVDEIKGKLKEGDDAKGELTTVRRRTAAVNFAKAAGLADETVDTLVAIPDLQEAQFEVKRAKVKNQNGTEEERDVAFLTLPGDGQQAMSFEDAKEKVPALKGLRTAEPPKGGTRTSQTSFVQQGPQGQGGGQNVYDRIRADREQEAKKQTEKTATVPIEERLRMKR